MRNCKLGYARSTATWEITPPGFNAGLAAKTVWSTNTKTTQSIMTRGISLPAENAAGMVAGRCAESAISIIQMLSFRWGITKRSKQSFVICAISCEGIHEEAEN